MVSTVSESYYNQYLRPRGFDMKAIPEYFHLLSANGSDIPYIGCFEADVTALGTNIPARLILVIKEDNTALTTASPPCILGMNILGAVLESSGSRLWTRVTEAASHRQTGASVGEGLDSSREKSKIFRYRWDDKSCIRTKGLCCSGPPR